MGQTGRLGDTPRCTSNKSLGLLPAIKCVHVLYNKKYIDNPVLKGRMRWFAPRCPCPWVMVFRYFLSSIHVVPISCISSKNITRQSSMVGLLSCRIQSPVRERRFIFHKQQNICSTKWQQQNKVEGCRKVRRLLNVTSRLYLLFCSGVVYAFSKSQSQISRLLCEIVPDLFVTVHCYASLHNGHEALRNHLRPAKWHSWLAGLTDRK